MTAVLLFTNTSSNPYNVYVNGIYFGSVSGKTSKSVTVNEGNSVTLKAEQVSGYVFYPTIKTSTTNFVRCSSYSWQFP
jgi:hypothetical protein